MVFIRRNIIGILVAEQNENAEVETL